MTLIYSNFSPAAGLIAISDVLTSTPKKRDAPSINLPLREAPFAFSSAAYSLHGTAQKSVVANATMVQWAGSLVVARAVLAHLLAATDDGRQFITKADLFSSSGLSREELEQTNFVYHFRDGPYLRRWEHGCRTVNGDNCQLMVAGTGDWHYMENTEIVTNIPDRGPMYFTAETISRAFRCLLSELHGDDNYGFHYGGWLEFATAGSNRFDKSLIAVKLWNINEDGNLHPFGPLIYSIYHEFDLYIVRIVWVDHDDKIVARPDFFYIGDFLGRTSSKPSIEDFQFRPTILCHHVLDRRVGSTTAHFDFEWTGIGISLALSKSGIDMSLADSLTDRLLGKVSAPLKFIINPDVHGISS